MTVEHQQEAAVIGPERDQRGGQRSVTEVGILADLVERHQEVPVLVRGEGDQIRIAHADEYRTPRCCVAWKRPRSGSAAWRP
ncbi:hypothetical protein BCD48_11125 [Pseudofrankia sp. BMG5.36]|nr:hypothetical protein BCD48_11125 [Pseudofrankia sp. BMG5.36]